MSHPAPILSDVRCPSCDFLAPEDARFCPNCGHALQAPSDERRIVTVLFADLVGFTSLSEHLDPEQVKNLVDRCFERLASDVAAFGGRVDKIVGDAMLALFGAPVAHEDDAERAVRAGLAMQESLVEEASALGIRVQLRVGINTGEVLVGAIRAGGDYTAMGDVVNTASRLQTIAQPAQVVVGNATHDLTVDRFRYEPLGLVQPRGREESVDAWVAVEVVTLPGWRPRRRRTPLIGRDAELGTLVQAVDAAVSNRRPLFCFIIGEAGMGKSRLAEELVSRARGEHDLLVLEGSSVPYGEANVWWPLAEAFRRAFSIDMSAGGDEARAKISAGVSSVLIRPADEPQVQRATEAFLYLMGYESGLSGADASRARDEVSWAVRRYLDDAANRQPVLLGIADVQWADPLVHEVIDHVLQRLHNRPIVVLLTARPAPDKRWRPEAGSFNSVVMHLDPLDTEESEELLDAMLDHDPGPEMRAALIERAGGNPFFLEELVHLVEDAGALGVPTEAIGALPTEAAVQGATTLPATLRALIASRLDALKTDDRGVLEDAAVVGRLGPLAVLETLGRSRGAADVTAGVDSLVSRDLLVMHPSPVGAQTFVGFRSDLVREVAYTILTKAERARRHAVVAQWLEGLEIAGDKPDELLEEIARHYATAAELVAEIGTVEGVPADVRARALGALDVAGERSEDRETHLASARIYEHELRLVGDEPGEARRHALIGRARAFMYLHRLDAARSDIEAAVAEATAEGDEVAVARAMTQQGELERFEGRLEESFFTLSGAISRWRALGDRRGEASALRRLGMTLMAAGVLDAAEPALLEALHAFQDLGAYRGQAWGLQNLAWISFLRGDHALADERLSEAIRLFDEVGDWGGMGWALALLGWVHLMRGRTDLAEDLAVERLPEFRERGDRWGVAMLTALLASVHLSEGRAGEAVDDAEEARRLFGAIGDAWGQLQAIDAQSRALLTTGRRTEAEALVEQARVVAAGVSTPQEQVMPTLLAASLAVSVGHPEAALEQLAAMPSHQSEADLPPLTASHGVLSGVAQLQLGRPEEAVEILERAAGAGPGAGPANVLAALALARAACGDVAGVAEALAELDELPSVPYHHRVIADIAEAAIAARTGRPTDAVAALSRAARRLEPTDDLLTRAILALARARVLEVLGDDEAAEAAAYAESQVARSGLDGAAGWECALRSAVGGPIPAQGVGAAGGVAQPSAGRS